MVFRAMIGFTGVQGNWGAVEYMPVSVASCIFRTIPIWTALAAHYLFKENLTKYDILSIGTAFVGVLIINDPFSAK